MDSLTYDNKFNILILSRIQDILALLEKKEETAHDIKTYFQEGL